MIRGVFGKKGVGATPPSPPLPPVGGGAGGPDRRQDAVMPWRDTAHEIAGNLAYTSLRESLPMWLEVKGRLQVEMLLAAAGGICGHACQRALLERVAGGEMPAEGELLTLELGGKPYYAGDALNRMFYGANDPNGTLWNLAAGTALGMGLPHDLLPSSADIFSPMAARLGGKDEGFPTSGEKHQPHLPVDQLLPILWPRVLECMMGRCVELNGQRYPAPVQLWPAITAWAATSALASTKGVLDPRIGLLIVMQSAAFGSKLHPSRVDGMSGAA